ncbi:MAG: hypothetical protein JO057_10090 [Chloroflexi bacterium]|nr:hypothetical protein [Chloroflexota bacterium]
MIGGFGYLLLTGTDLDVITKGIGVLICLIALTAVTNNAIGPNKPSS